MIKNCNSIFIRRSPEGLNYLAYTLVCSSFPSIQDLTFYDYKQVVILFKDKDDFNQRKNQYLEFKEKSKNYNVFIFYSIKNSSSSEIKIFDVKNKKSIINEIKKAHIIYNLEINDKNDRMDLVYGNFNQVYAKEMMLRNVVLGISIESFYYDYNRFKNYLGRLRQNLKIARKYKVPVLLTSFDSNTIFSWYNALQLLRTLL